MTWKIVAKNGGDDTEDGGQREGVAMLKTMAKEEVGDVIDGG